MPEDVSTVRGVDADRLDLLAVDQDVCEVAELTVNPRGDDLVLVGRVREQLPCLRPGVHRALARPCGVGAGDGDTDAVHGGRHGVLLGNRSGGSRSYRAPQHVSATVARGAVLLPARHHAVELGPHELEEVEGVGQPLSRRGVGSQAGDAFLEPVFPSHE